jgi:Tfp pilus assembly protein FimV
MFDEEEKPTPAASSVSRGEAMMARPQAMSKDHDDHALRRAYRERILRDADAHRIMAERVAETEERHRRELDERDARIADLEAQNADLRSEIAGKDRELRTLLSTKTFRYTAAVRRFYGRLRGRP